MSDDALDVLVHGRIDAVALTPETGLVVLTVWCPGGARHLGVGVGPRVVGVGWVAKKPSFTTGTKHPLVAAMRAHVLGHPVRSLTRDDDDGALWITVGETRVEARVRLFPAVAGEVRVIGHTGDTVLVWSGERVRLPRVCEPEGTLDAVGRELARTSDGLAAELRRAAIVRALGGHAKKLVRRAEAVQADLERLDDVGRLQRIGRMLLAQGAKIPRGATRALLDDWEEGGTLEIELDPALPAKPQAEGFFQKARRLQRGEAIMWKRLEDTERALTAARALEATVRDAEEVTPELLARWTTDAKALGVNEAATSVARGRTKAGPRLPFIEYLGWKERRILVGRGAKDNDRLTAQVARPHDLWLHARGVAGAHVVVPLEKGAECPAELLLDAATLAAYHSDARDEDFVEVTWTEKRYVRKPRKSPTGRVVLDREKVLPLRVERARIERLLAARREQG